LDLAGNTVQSSSEQELPLLDDVILQRTGNVDLTPDANASDSTAAAADAATATAHMSKLSYDDQIPPPQSGGSAHPSAVIAHHIHDGGQGSKQQQQKVVADHEARTSLSPSCIGSCYQEAPEPSPHHLASGSSHENGTAVPAASSYLMSSSFRDKERQGEERYGSGRADPLGMVLQQQEAACTEFDLVELLRQARTTS
jgi:hypothetical protein